MERFGVTREDALKEIALLREIQKREYGEHWDSGDVEKEKKRNRSTNAGSCTAAVRAHKGANKQTGLRRRSSSSSLLYKYGKIK